LGCVYCVLNTPPRKEGRGGNKRRVYLYERGGGGGGELAWRITS